MNECFSAVSSKLSFINHSFLLMDFLFVKTSLCRQLCHIIFWYLCAYCRTCWVCWSRQELGGHDLKKKKNKLFVSLSFFLLLQNEQNLKMFYLKIHSSCSCQLKLLTQGPEALKAHFLLCRYSKQVITPTACPALSYS